MYALVDRRVNEVRPLGNTPKNTKNGARYTTTKGGVYRKRSLFNFLDKDLAILVLAVVFGTILFQVFSVSSYAYKFTLDEQVPSICNPIQLNTLLRVECDLFRRHFYFVANIGVCGVAIRTCSMERRTATLTLHEHQAVAKLSHMVRAAQRTTRCYAQYLGLGG